MLTQLWCSLWPFLQIIFFPQLNIYSALASYVVIKQILISTSNFSYNSLNKACIIYLIKSHLLSSADAPSYHTFFYFLVCPFSLFLKVYYAFIWAIHIISKSIPTTGASNIPVNLLRWSVHVLTNMSHILNEGNRCLLWWWRCWTTATVAVSQVIVCHALSEVLFIQSLLLRLHEICEVALGFRERTFLLPRQYRLEPWLPLGDN